MGNASDLTSKLKELHEGLAKETGVDVQSVAKILSHLGLERAVRNRLEKASEISDTRLTNVTVDTLRVSAGAGPSM